jgi:hypothetical protein
MSLVKNIHKICDELGIKNYTIQRIDKSSKDPAYLQYIPVSSVNGKMPDIIFSCPDLFEYDYYFFYKQSYSIIKLQLSFILKNPDDFSDIPYYHYYEEF